MKTQILKPVLLTLAGAVSLAATASAQAMSPPYLACTFKGQTVLAAGGTSIGCWLNTVVKVDCDGNVIEVAAAGANAGDSSCPGLFTGNFPWASDLPSIMAGNGTINTSAGSGGAIPFSVMDAGGSPLAGGNVYNVAGGGPLITYVCDGNNVDVPSFVQITGTNNFGPGPDGDPGNVTFNTVGPDHLQNLGCN